jgi:hypothetical protein
MGQHINGCRTRGPWLASQNSSTAYAVLGQADYGTVAKAGYFSGQVIATRVHRVAERKQLHDGVAAADSVGQIELQLPSCFEAVNADIRYPLTPICGAAPSLCIKEEVRGGRFLIVRTGPRLVSGALTRNRTA